MGRRYLARLAFPRSIPLSSRAGFLFSLGPVSGSELLRHALILLTLCCFSKSRETPLRAFLRGRLFVAGSFPAPLSLIIISFALGVLYARKHPRCPNFNTSCPTPVIALFRLRLGPARHRESKPADLDTIGAVTMSARKTSVLPFGQTVLPLEPFAASSPSMAHGSQLTKSGATLELLLRSSLFSLTIVLRLPPFGSSLEPFLSSFGVSVAFSNSRHYTGHATGAFFLDGRLDSKPSALSRAARSPLRHLPLGFVIINSPSRQPLGSDSLPRVVPSAFTSPLLSPRPRRTRSDCGRRVEEALADSWIPKWPPFDYAAPTTCSLTREQLRPHPSRPSWDTEP